MSQGTTTIFGSWNELPQTGYCDEITESWHWLAAQHVGTPKFQPNSGLSQRRHEFTMLLDIYRRAQPRIVLEVGSAQAGSLAAFCIHGRRDALIIAIDRSTNDARPRPGEDVHPRVASGSNYPMTENGGGMYALGKSSQIIRPINGWTTEQSTKDTLAKVLDGRKIDFCFHDASHEADMFRQDFQWLWPLIADGGVFSSHDIMRSDDPKCNKKEAWDEIKATTDYSALMEFTAGPNEQNMGIGVLIK